MILKTLDQVKADLTTYNQNGLHYEVMSRAIYARRAILEPSSAEFMRYIVAGLIVFDMGRWMGSNPFGTFLSDLHLKTKSILQDLGPIASLRLEDQYTLSKSDTDGIRKAFDELAGINKQTSM